ncbi:MAG TPA: acyl carrier protein [Elusimicrobiales bacterium]|nr:acyl carrier protein [Elusimicrobiales bacterium]HPO95951.1 acyl carrier protein [Elusimicrobiales bacterium]
MTRENVAEEIKKLISESLSTDINEIKEDSKFVDDLGADSLDIVELVMSMEKKFDIEIPDEDAQKIKTVGEAIDYISNRVSK